jgi:murein DD-endopeptidase MepM/ murein hydrolase activator NlpD
MRKLAIASVGGLLAAAPASAPASTTGGMQSQTGPRIASVSCRTDCAGARTARPGSLVRVKGDAMRRVRTVTFLGGRGDRDDVTEPVAEATPHSVLVRVPARARPGRLRARDASREPSPPSRVRIAIAPPAHAFGPGPSGHVFPVRGPHAFGGPGSQFGAERPGHVHQGQDVGAACGTPLVAARGGTVRWRAFHANAGNYVVIAADTGLDHVYMHLEAPSLVRRGQAVATGQPIGTVGATGRASGCHLHFELWSAPGWFEGGRALDPLATLRSWVSP